MSPEFSQGSSTFFDKIYCLCLNIVIDIPGEEEGQEEMGGNKQQS